MSAPHFAYEKDIGDKLNFDKPLAKMEKVLNVWSGQDIAPSWEELRL